MNFFEKYQITPYINAHDTYTVYGGSRMSASTAQAMREASEHFVDWEEMQRKLGAHIAKLTNNEGAYLTNGASGAVLLAACVCMTGGDDYLYSRLPDVSESKNEIIVMRAQRNAYDKAIEASGAKVIEIGDADETLAFELAGRINERTAAVFYFASTLYQRGSMTLEETIRIAHGRNVPVVVDAAAQLPPVENLWKFTEAGADLVIFSGGKTLMGPADSGLLLGRGDLIEHCIRLGAPAHGVCRSSKTSREAMAGLTAALESYIALDHKENTARLRAIDMQLQQRLEKAEAVEKTEIVEYGPVGQTYPRLFLYLKEDCPAQEVEKKMRERHIYIGKEAARNAVYLSPLNLNEKEAEIVGNAMFEVLSK